MQGVELKVTDDEIAVVTLNRPERRNALSGNTLAELHRLFDEIGGRPELRVAVITGAGAAFCAGADMKAGAEDMNATGGTPTGDLVGRVRGDLTLRLAMQELMAGLFEKVHRLRQPVIAAVNGAAHGGGFALAKAREIAANPPLAVWMTKETMWQTVDSPSLRHALDLENRTQILCTGTGEISEAFAAFRERRPPRWQPL